MEASKDSLQVGRNGFTMTVDAGFVKSCTVECHESGLAREWEGIIRVEQQFVDLLAQAGVVLAAFPSASNIKVWGHVVAG